MCKILHDRIWTDVAALAFLALAATPHLVKLLYGGVHQRRLVGEDARLEVAVAVTLHAHAGSREVRGADVCRLEVKNHHLEMNTRAHYAFQIRRKNLEPVKVLAEVRARLLRVNEPHAHPALQEAGKLSQQGNRVAILFHVHILDIGRTDPQRIADLRNTRDDFGVMLLVLNVFCEDGHGGKYNTKSPRSSRGL